MAGSRLLWTEEVAERLGVSPRWVKKMLSMARANRRAGKPRPRDIPEPFDTKARKVWNGHHHVTVRSPRWRASVIDNWQRPGPGSGQGLHKSDPTGERAAS